MRIILLLLLPALGSAECVRAIHNHPYASVELAAAAALGRLIHEGQTAEHAGYILEVDGGYRYSVGVTQGHPSTVTLGCIIFLPGSKLAAVYHSHQADPGFSKADKRQAARLGVPSYIGTLRDGWVLRYEPETRETVKVGTIEQTGEAQVSVTWRRSAGAGKQETVH